MKINISDLKWRSVTGLNKERFYKLLFYFKQSYLATYGKDLNTRQVENNLHHYCIKDEERRLLTLFSLKSGLTYGLLGLVCGMDASNAKRNQKIGLDSLESTLKKVLGHLPKRYFTTVDEFKAYFSAHKHLIVDATEQNVQRPSYPEQQKQSYSGKKNAYAKVYDYFKWK